MSLQHLPNAPLIEAMFELRFPGEPAVLTTLDQYYDSIRQCFPQVFVPNAQPGIAPALQPWEFKNAEGTRWVSMSINTFAVHVLDYMNHEDFRSLALPLADKFCEQFQISHLTRVGTRFVNQIVLLRTPGQPIPLSDYLNIRFQFPAIVDPSTLEDIHVQFATRREDAQLVVGLHHIREQAAQPESLVLELDCGIVDNVSSGRLSEHLDVVHGCVEDLFAALASDAYMKYMRGETA